MNQLRLRRYTYNNEDLLPLSLLQRWELLENCLRILRQLYFLQLA